MGKRIIRAVLAGINDYPPPIPPLRGCVHDTTAVGEYLKAQAAFDVQLTMLLNEQVTVEGLTSAWRTCLSSAQPTDIVFLYYSGHGTREEADPVFADIEQDNALEAIVCYDSVRNSGGKFEFQLFADKEIHYLISKFAQDGTHVVTVFDCCHSGGVTRNMFLPRVGEVLERRVSMVVPRRPWNQFLFGSELNHDEVAGEGWLKLVPQKAHITMSACQNDESAFEVDGQGVFTTNLLKTLARSGTGITYYDLQARVRMLTQNHYRQTPEIYAVRGHENDLLRGFLDHTASQSAFGCTCYADKEHGWAIDLGAMHGLSQYCGAVVITDGEAQYEADINTIHAHFATLKFKDREYLKLDESVAYAAALSGFVAGNSTFYLESDSDQGLVEDVIGAIEEMTKPVSFTIAADRAMAQYVVRQEKGKIMICANDDEIRPVSEFLATDPVVAQSVLRGMRHIAQWEYIRSLYNPDFKLTTYPVEITFYRIAANGSKTEIPFDGDTLLLEYDRTSGSDYGGKLKVQIGNKSDVKYYCTLLYLSNTFQIYGNMLDGKVVGLGPAESVWVYNGDVVELDLEDHVVDYNFEYSIFYLKLLVNTKPFAVEPMEQSSLPAPTLSVRRDAGEGVLRGLKTRDEAPIADVTWFSRTICLKCRNPHYQAKSA